MASLEEISQHVSGFLANRVSLDEFEDWSASYAWNIHQRADKQTAARARLIQAILDAFEDDDDEAGLRAELENAIHPFARPDEVGRIAVRTVECLYGVAPWYEGATSSLPYQDLEVSAVA